MNPSDSISPPATVPPDGSDAYRPDQVEAKWQARLRQLQPIRICPIQPGERAPYPSCASKN